MQGRTTQTWTPPVQEHYVTARDYDTHATSEQGRPHSRNHVDRDTSIIMMRGDIPLILDSMITAVDEGFSDGIVSIPEAGLEDTLYRVGLAGWVRDRVDQFSEAISIRFRKNAPNIEMMPFIFPDLPSPSSSHPTRPPGPSNLTVSPGLEAPYTALPTPHRIPRPPTPVRYSSPGLEAPSITALSPPHRVPRPPRTSHFYRTSDVSPGFEAPPFTALPTHHRVPRPPRTAHSHRPSYETYSS